MTSPDPHSGFCGAPPAPCAPEELYRPLHPPPRGVDTHWPHRMPALGAQWAASGKSRELPGVGEGTLFFCLMGELTCPGVYFSEDCVPGAYNSAWNIAGAQYRLALHPGRPVGQAVLWLLPFPAHIWQLQGQHTACWPWMVSTCEVLLCGDALCPRLQHTLSQPGPLSRLTLHIWCPHGILQVGLLVPRLHPREGTRR